MDQELLVGVLLIIVGLAIGLIAVALVMNRRAGLEAQPAEASVPPEAGEDSPPEIEVPVATGSEAAPAAVAVPAEPEPATTGSAQPKLVAEIFRDESSGGLILRAGGRDYRGISQIEDEQLRMDLSILASDPAGRLGAAGRITAPASGPRAPARPGSQNMLEAINSILQRALAEAGNQAKGVQLIPDAAGGVKVLIGLKSYALDEVPEEEIRRLIRESVAEWEASQ